MINFEDFKKVDIRIGKIIKAEAIEGSDKLLKIMVDLGEENNRQIIAGIGKHYQPSELEERQVAVVTNLEPRTIFGHESQGMILATGDEKPSLLRPDEDVAPGSEIR